MQVETIKGRVASFVIGSTNEKVTKYKSLVFDLPSGLQRTLENIVVARVVNAAIVPGTEGRFYAYRGINHVGLMAMRCKDGRHAFAIPSGEERIMLGLIIAGFCVLIGVFAARGTLSNPGLLMAIGGSVAYAVLRLIRMTVRAAYDADGS